MSDQFSKTERTHQRLRVGNNVILEYLMQLMEILVQYERVDQQLVNTMLHRYIVVSQRPNVLQQHPNEKLATPWKHFATRRFDYELGGFIFSTFIRGTHVCPPVYSCGRRFSWTRSSRRPTDSERFSYSSLACIFVRLSTRKPAGRRDAVFPFLAYPCTPHSSDWITALSLWGYVARSWWHRSKPLTARNRVVKT